MIVGLAALPWECATLRNCLQHVTRWRPDGRWAAWVGEAGKQSVGVVQCGMGPVRAEFAAEAVLRHEPVTALLSFGCAGGLSPELRPGTLIVAKRVLDAVSGAATFPAETLRDGLVAAARAAELPVEQGSVVSTARPLLTQAEKEQAARSFSAVAVDMESAAIAAVAERHHIPFACVRAVLDPVEVALPADGLVDPEGGRPRAGALLRMLLRRPAAAYELRHLREFQQATVRSLEQLFATWVPLLNRRPSKTRAPQGF